MAHGITRLTAARYQPSPGRHLPRASADLTVVVRLAGHEPAALARSLQSWAGSGVREVIVLAGPEDERCHQVLEQFAVTVIRRRGDPRLDLRAGWRAATSTYVALAEPGTIWSPDVAEHVLSAFAGAETGAEVTGAAQGTIGDPSAENSTVRMVSAVAVRQNVVLTRWGRGWGRVRERERRLNHLRARTGDMTLDLRTFGTAAAGSQLAGAVTGAWSGTAVFRADVLRSAEQDFLDVHCDTAGLSPNGVAAVLAEQLAELILMAGHATVFQRNAQVWRMPSPRPAGPGPAGLRWLQPLRDAFSGGRSSWPLVRRQGFGRAARRRPYRAACLLDDVLAGPQAVLLAGYLAVPMLIGAWQASAALGGWVIFTRGVLLLPHLRRHPMHVTLVPLHLASTGLHHLARSAGHFAGLLGGSRSAAAAEPGSAADQIPAPDPALRLMAIQPRVDPVAPSRLRVPAHVPVARQAPVATFVQVPQDSEADLELTLRHERAQRA